MTASTIAASTIASHTSIITSVQVPRFHIYIPEKKKLTLKDKTFLLIKLPSKGHFGDGPVVPCREVVLFWEVFF